MSELYTRHFVTGVRREEDAMFVTAAFEEELPQGPGVEGRSEEDIKQVVYRESKEAYVPSSKQTSPQVRRSWRFETTDH